MTAGSAELRGLAARILDQVRDSRAPAEGFLAPARSSLDARDAALLSELVLGTLRWQGRLDDVLELAAARPVSDIDTPLLNPVRLALYQLLRLDRVPPHAAVSEAVEEVRRRGLHHATGFVNAVLRKVARRPRLAAWPVRATDPVQRLAVEQSHPEWMVRRWAERFGVERTAQLLAANNRPRRPTLLAFPDRGGRRETMERLAAEGVATRASSLSPLGMLVERGDPMSTESFRQGIFYVQDAASQAAAWVPPPVAGERVLDVAAAPGGKSLALLSWEPRVEVVAADRSLGRLTTMRRNLRRLGRRLPLFVANAAELPVTATFDRVLVDLPCSGTGTLRKHPELKWRLQPAEIDRLAERGLRLAHAAAAAVRQGGRLILITCSIEPEENEELVEHLLADDDELRCEALAGRLPPSLAEHVKGTCGWQVLPTAEHDGFTVHALSRRDRL